MTEEVTKIDPSLKDHEFNEYWEHCGKINDPTLMILRVHLYCEYLIDRLFVALVKRPDRLLRDARLSFYQKIRLVHSFNVLPDELVSALDGLNSVRNDFAHDIGKTISMRDIDRIGHSFGDQLIKYKKDNKYIITDILNDLSMYICSGLAYHANKLETKMTKNDDNE